MHTCDGGRAGVSQSPRCDPGPEFLTTNVAEPRNIRPVPFSGIETNGPEEPHQGVFIVQGTNLRVSNISFSIDRATGEVTASPVQLETSIDVWSEWLQVAIDRAVAAAEIEDEAEEAHVAGDDNTLGVLLRRVMREGMQAIAAAAFAIEGFQDGVHARMPVPDALLQTWRANRTAQHTRVAETLRRATKVTNKQSQTLATATASAFRFRRLAVHPSAQFASPALHPRFGRVMEHKFVVFRAENAAAAARLAVEVIAFCIGHPKRPSNDYREWLSAQQTTLDPIVDGWPPRFEPLRLSEEQ